MSNTAENKANQANLKRAQLEKDRGQTLGAARKDMCKEVAKKKLKHAANAI
jgi:hypothetical protein